MEIRKLFWIEDRRLVIHELTGEFVDHQPVLSLCTTVAVTHTLRTLFGAHNYAK